MLHHRNLPGFLWGEAAHTYVYLLNRSVNRNTVDTTPYELYFGEGKKPSVAHLRAFGCLAVAKTQIKKRSGYQVKVETRAVKGIHVGYEADFTYRFFDPAQKKIIVTLNVQFDEANDYYTNEQTYNDLDQVIADDEGDLESADDASEGAPEVEDGEAMVAMGHFEPLTYKQAISCADAKEWCDAVDEEYRSLIENNTWTLEDLPPDRRAVSCKWVFKLKYAPDNSIARYKARLVARGYTQREGIDFTETFSPVVRMESVRMLLVIANQLDMQILQIDVKTAFLNGELEESIFMTQPEGYVKERGKVCRLQRSIYGLKQWSLQWNKCFTNFLRRFSMRPLKSDTCVFVNANNKCGVTLIICIHVDDGLVMCNSSKLMEECLNHLRSKFQISVGQPDTFVGIQIRRDEQLGELCISQTSYIQRVIEKFRVERGRDVTTPMEPNIALSQIGVLDVESKPVEVPYRELLGSLLYAATGTRIDIAYSVNLLARFCENPRLVH